MCNFEYHCLFYSPSKHRGKAFVPLISHFFLHINCMTHWLLPFAKRTEMEEVRKGFTPTILKLVPPSTQPTLGGLECLTYQSTLLNLLLVRLQIPPRLRLLQDRTMGLVVKELIENIKWQTSALCNADASQWTVMRNLLQIRKWGIKQQEMNQCSSISLHVTWFFM